ncbi:MAG TPA: IS66 family transposase [Chthonomonadales bacterium]|nr:IS66 family transposase [Chthonomonadales bacterium]
MKQPRRRIEVNLEELDRVLDGAREAPLSEEDHRKLREALHALAAMLVRPRNTEKTSSVVGKPEDEAGDSGKQPDADAPPPPGHGRNGTEAFSGATRVEVKHATLAHGDRCPACGQGNVYAQKEPKVLVRVIGQAPLAATVYSLERLRCGACGQVFTAQAPEGVGEGKYDESAAAMIAQLKYGSGTPFNRLEQLEKQMGIALPAATQWEIVARAAHPIKPARDELIRQAAQGEVVHNDDTSMRVLRLERDPRDGRTGVFTSGIVATSEGRKIALYFPGPKHAGENLADVLKKRSRELPAPIQMCDALSRNVPELAPGVEILLANCMAHGRRQFVDVAENFPGECRYVLEMLAQVYGNDAEARELGMTPDQRLQLHQQHSTPIMDELHLWLESQLAERKTEPNSGLGQAINYLLRHWQPLTLFLRKAGAPLDNNIVERSLKRAVLHRKNALYYRTLNGAQVGDLFMSLIHTCQLCGANSFDYLVELQRHARQLAASPSEWMPWNYRDTLMRTAQL